MKRDILCISTFVFVVLIFFAPTITQGKLPVPSDTLVGLYHPWRDLYVQEYPRGIPFKNFLITDPIRQQIPWRKTAIDELRQGRFPVWNPYTFSGTPLLGNIQSGALYPLNILFLFLPFQIAWTILIILEPLLAGIFLYLYLRSLHFKPESSLFGALGWSFCGFTIAWLTWGTIVHTALWLPILLLAIDQLFKKQRHRIVWIGILTGALIAGFFAGHAQIFLYMLLLSGIYVWYRYHKNSKALLTIGCSFLLFVLITSVQWREMFALVSASSRVSETQLMLKEGWFVPWQHVLQLFIPDFFGNPATLNYWGTWNYGELVSYIGVLPLLFVFVALVRKKTTETKFWLSVLGVAVLFVLPTPIAKLPFILNIPLLSTLQPTRLLVIVEFCLIMLSVVGFESVLSTVIPKNYKKGLLIIGGTGSFYIITFLVMTIFPSITIHTAVAQRNMIMPFLIFVLGSICLGFLMNKRTRVVGMIGILVLVSIDLLRFGQKFTPFTPVEYFFPETEIISYIKKQSGPFRVLALDDRLVPPNALEYYGIESISGYDPVYLSSYEELIVAMERGKADLSRPFGFNRIITPKNIESSLFPLLNVRYVLSMEDLNKHFLRLVMQEGETRLYEYADALSRAWFVDGVTSVLTPQEALTMISQDEFDVKKQAVITEPLTLMPIDNFSGNVSFISSTLSSFTIHTSASAPRFVAISIPYYAKWYATVDGMPLKIYKTNYTFQGVIAPVGEHDIQFTYGD